MKIEPSCDRFRLGINYWPARTGMGFWADFDPAEVEADFARIAAVGFDSVRLFLTWEHFQPRAGEVDPRMIARLVTTLEIASKLGLSTMPTLFTGHMSGVNLIPPWALGGSEGDQRFRIVSAGRVVDAGLRNWYADAQIAHAQARLAGELGRAVAGHPALWAWDLGNENSNCVTPPTRAHGRDWLERMCDAIREADEGALITIGLHMEDLEQDRKLGPTEAAERCDFLTMHGYPGYAAWARGATDEALLPFLACVTRWLGGGADVVFSEFGLPTFRAGDAESERGRGSSASELIEEHAAAAYIERALSALVESGCKGAMLWCHADYVPALWHGPPFDAAVHERFFGQWRADGSSKPALAAASTFVERGPVSASPPPDTSWIDIAPVDFYRPDGSSLARLYRRYCALPRLSSDSKSLSRKVAMRAPTSEKP